MLSYFVIIPLLTAVFLYVFSTAKTARIIAVIVQAALAGYAGRLFMICKDGSVITSIGGYEDTLGITLRADTLSSVFVALVAFLFFIAALYSVNEQKNKLFWLLLFVWEGLLTGIFLTRDLFNTFVLMEVAMVVVAILIMFNRDKRSMYDGMFYLMINIVVMQFYLFGVGYVYKLTGVLDMEAAASILVSLDKSSLVLPYALIMTAIAAAAVVGIVSLCNGSGRFLWASFSDFVGRPIVYSGFLLLQAGLFLGLAFTNNPIVFQALLYIIASCYGGGFACIPAYLSDMFGIKQVSAIHGRVLTAWACAGVIGPFFTTWAVKTSGGYTGILMYISIALVTAFAVSIIAAREYKKRHGSLMRL